MNWRLYRLIFTMMLLIQGLYCGDFGRLGSLHRKAFYKSGDINIGAMFQVHSYDGNPNMPVCFERVTHHTFIQFSEAINYAVNEINSDGSILPNVTLGFVVLDDCGNEMTLAARALQLLPLVDYTKTSSSLLHYGDQFNVAAVFGPTRSSLEQTLSNILGGFNIPVLGLWATHDELSNKDTYPYHSRLVPPDFYQTKVIIQFIKNMNWNYFSVFYIESSYGYDANRNMVHWARENGICVANSYGLSTTTSDDEYVQIIQDMVAKKQARAMVIFAYYPVILRLMEHIEKADLIGEFIWIISECFAEPGIQVIRNIIPGSIRLVFYDALNPGLEDYLSNQLHPGISDNPYLHQLWEEQFQCSLHDSCNDHRLREIDHFFTTRAERYVDGVHVLAKAFHNLIAEKCPEVFEGNKTALASCMKGRQILHYLRNVEIQRPSRFISFDTNGDAMRRYTFLQIQSKPYFKYSPVMTIDPTGNITEQGKMKWRELKMSEKEEEIGQPISVCSEPCDPGYIYLQGELQCCWTCYKCLQNEITDDNATSCIPCPDLTWPDPISQFTMCTLIPPSFMTIVDTYGLVLVILTTIGLLAVFVCLLLLILYRKKKIIKASNIFSMIILLMGATLGYATIAFLVLRPTNITCALSRHFLNLSLTITFATVLVKTSAVYKIFRESNKFKQKLNCVGRQFQISFIFLVVAAQVTLTVLTGYFWSPDPVLLMPVRTMYYVELVCSLPKAAMLSTLSFNMALLLCCTLLGFLTRKLPENFNESWYIFLSMFCTLIVWTAFFPTYFSAFYAYHQAALLGLALILNHSIVLLFLFAPKFYAAVWVQESQLKFLFIPSSTGSTALADTEKSASLGSAGSQENDTDTFAAPEGHNAVAGQERV